MNEQNINKTEIERKNIACPREPREALISPSTWRVSLASVIEHGQQPPV